MAAKRSKPGRQVEGLGEAASREESSNRSEVGKRRTRARRQALQMLFARDFAGADGSEGVATIAEVMDDVVPEPYALELCEGIAENQDRIDNAIEVASENWKLSRMPSTDRSILRIAVFELLYRDDIPAGVSINEAVELAQDFGGEDDSFRFVNGVLGNVASRISEKPGNAAETRGMQDALE